MMVYDDDSKTPIDFIADFTYIPLLIKITNDNREKKIPSLSSCVKKYVGKTIAIDHILSFIGGFTEYICV